MNYVSCNLGKKYHRMHILYLYVVQFPFRLLPWAVKSWWRRVCWAGRRWNMRWWEMWLITVSLCATWRTLTHWAFTQVLKNTSNWCIRCCDAINCYLFCFAWVFSLYHERVLQDENLFFMLFADGHIYCVSGWGCIHVLDSCYWESVLGWNTSALGSSLVLSWIYRLSSWSVHEGKQGFGFHKKILMID